MAANKTTLKKGTAKKAEEAEVKVVAEVEEPTTEEPVTEEAVAPVEVESAEENTVDGNVSLDTEVESKTASKMCRVKLAKDHRCTIGGVTYNFNKDGVYDVPPNVKSILRRGDLIRPLK